MGTFHSGRGELHGITVVVDTHGPQIFIGRCDTMDESSIVLVGADEHQDGQDGRSKVQYVEQVKQQSFGPKHSRLEIPMSEVSSVERLGQWVPAKP